MANATRKKKAGSKSTTVGPKEIERALSRPGISPDELYQLNLIPVARNGIYDACNRGEIECLRIGRKIIILTAPLRRKLGMTGA